MAHAIHTDTMEIMEKRRERLRRLLKEEYGNDRKAFIQRTGINAGELCGLLKSKVFGDRRAASLAIACGKPADYFERERSIDELNDDHLHLLAIYDAADDEGRNQLMLLANVIRIGQEAKQKAA